MKIKVLHMIHSLVSGGAEKQLSLLANNMNVERFGVNVFCVNTNGSEIDTRKVNLFVVKDKNPFKWAYLKSMWHIIRKTDPDIVHIWLPASVSIPAMIFAFLLRKRVIFSYRNRMMFSRWLCYPEYLLVLISAKLIISNHKITYSNILYKLLFWLKNGIVINNAVQVPEMYSKMGNILTDCVKFVFIGRLTAQKNPILLIEALSSIKDRNDWSLDIYGKGELEDTIMSLINSSGLQDKVTIKGFTSEPYAVLKEADCLIFPSIHEGMPNVLIEAFIIGLPVIASDIIENRDIIMDGDAVIWIDPHDKDSISNGVKSFLDMDLATIKNKIMNGKSISSSFSLDKMVKNFENVYSSLIK